MNKTLKAISDPACRKILELMQKGSLTAGAVAENFEISLPAISRHLHVLKEADLVRTERNGNFMIYTLNTSVLDEALLWISSLKQSVEELAGEILSDH